MAVLIGIGIPNSGKTTTLKRIARANDWTYVSSDEIRLEITGDTLDQTKNPEIWTEVYKLPRTKSPRFSFQV